MKGPSSLDTRASPAADHHLSPMSNGTAGGKKKRAAKKISHALTKKLGSPPRFRIKSPSSSARPSSNNNSDRDVTPPAQDIANRSAHHTSPTSPPRPVPPDEVLTRMNVFLKRKLRDVSVQDYYRIVWSEERGDGINEPFYAPWLESCGKFNIHVGSWEDASSCTSSGTGIVNPWDGESYDRQRIVTFTTKRSGIGPSTADATQTQRCRLEGNDRCIVSLTINMKVPFGDCFSVEVRWVVSRADTSSPSSRELSVSCGMIINFNKSCFVEGKIRANTTVETQKGQTSLFDNMKNACRATITSREGSNDVAEEDDDEEEEEGAIVVNQLGYSDETQHKSWLEAAWSVFLTLIGWRLISYVVDSLFSFFRRPQFDEDRQDIVQGIKEAHSKLEAVQRILQCEMTQKEVNRIRAVIPIVNDALGKLIIKAKPNSTA
mmetsp:Transcript_34956/g.75749  ORF Transcript_34956/g.75749 Transcript_34956/m.75749 type:complete len:433 (-) Transcript_34956:911-2209(-)